ncbi:MAG TPA: type II CAAX endopeptidase family protein [Gryllotalpicola sp.]
MSEASVESSPPVAPGTPPKWARSPWVRVPILLGILLAIDGVCQAINGVADVNPVTGLLVGVALGVAGVFAYALLVRWLEARRWPAELALRAAAPGLAWGVLLGLALFSAVIAVIALAGGYRVLGIGSIPGAVAYFGAMWTIGVSEEVIFRGALFRLVEEGAGTWVALAASALVFGGAHLLNAHATVWGALAIAIEAGVLFGAVYAATRTLWLVIGLHFAWNFAEGGIYGAIVSGNDQGTTSILRAGFSGPTLLTGGDFGPEASLVSIIVCLIPAVIFLVLAHRRGRIRPLRRRR